MLVLDLSLSFYRSLGTHRFASIAVLAAGEGNHLHKYKRRDDFESHFNCWLTLVNLTTTFQCAKDSYSRCSQMFDDWDSKTGNVKQNREKVDREELEFEWKELVKAKDRLFLDYPEENFEDAQELYSLFES